MQMKHFMIIISALILFGACTDGGELDSEPNQVVEGSTDGDGSFVGNSNTAVDDGADEPEPSGEQPADGPVDGPVDEPGDDPINEPDDPEVDPCPEGIFCVETYPWTHAHTTVGGSFGMDRYGCAPDIDESGPEVLYRLEVPVSGFLTLDLVNVEAGVDVDVHLLQSRDEGDCVDRGHWRAGGLVEAGRYWAVVDTWVDGERQVLEGGYTLRVNLSTKDDLISVGISPELAQDAIYAFGVAWANADTERFDYAITDFSLHSSERRQWIIDLGSGELLWNLHVAHGEGSIVGADKGYASIFSNIPESHQSSLGMLRSAEMYTGDYGISFQLDGLEEGYNHLVRPRDIVMHPWEGSSPEYVTREGIVRPSWGCPAIDPAVAADVVARLADGTMMLFWYPDEDWRQSSRYMPQP